MGRSNMKEISTTASGPSNNNYQRPLKSYCIFWIMTTQIDIIARQDYAHDMGVEEGAAKERAIIAKQMLADSVPPETVAKYTGLSVEDLAKL